MHCASNPQSQNKGLVKAKHHKLETIIYFSNLVRHNWYHHYSNIHRVKCVEFLPLNLVKREMLAEFQGATQLQPAKKCYRG